MSQFYQAVTAGSLPPSVPLQFTGNSGVSVPVANNENVVTSNSTIKFAGASDTLTLNLAGDVDGNLMIGTSLPFATTPGLNTSLGILSLNSTTSGSYNVAIGSGALTSLTTGSDNVAVGVDAGDITTGSYNIFIGTDAGNAVDNSSNSNILIGSQGTTGESNAIRIGRKGSGNYQQDKAFISGISGVTVANSAPVLVSSSSDQLSTAGFGTSGQIFTSNGAGVSPSWQAGVTSNTANSAIASGSAVSLTTATNADITSISLAAGTWMVSALVQLGGTPTVSGAQQVSISTTSATHGTLGDNSLQTVWLTSNFTVGNLPAVIPSYLLTVGSTTTVYLVASGIFSGGTMTAYGRISAVKIA